MIRLDRVELLHWDVQPHQVLPLSSGITLLTGENGSGKTSVLDGIKVALGVSRLGGDRDVAKYLAKQARAVAMVRVVVDNRFLPGTRQRPFDRLGEFNSDLVTLAVVFRAQDEAKYVQDCYLLDGDVVPPFDGGGRTVKPLPSPSDYRQRLARVGLSERYLKLLSLPQGQIASLCKRDPETLFDDLYDIIGGRQTLESWEERLKELRAAQQQYETIAKDLEGARNGLQALAARVRRHEDWKRVESRCGDVQAALPHVELREARTRTERLNEQIGRLTGEIEGFQGDHDRASKQARIARDEMTLKGAQRNRLKQVIADERLARDEVFKHYAQAGAEFEVLDQVRAKSEFIAWEDRELLTTQSESLRAQRASLASEATRRSGERESAEKNLERVEQGILPLPSDVERFRSRLRVEGIAHDLLHEVVEIEDTAWQGAIEGYLGRYRFAVLVRDLVSWSRAAAIAREEKYSHGVLAPDVRGYSPQDETSIARRLHVQDPDYRALVARLLRPVVEGETTDPLEPTRRGEILSRAGFLVSRIEARHAWADEIFLGREALRRHAEELRNRIRSLAGEDTIAAAVDEQLKHAIADMECRLAAQQQRRAWEDCRARHADLRAQIGELFENVKGRDSEIREKVLEDEQLQTELLALEGDARAHETTSNSSRESAKTKSEERARIEAELAQAESIFGKLLAMQLPEPTAAVQTVLDEGFSLATLKARLAIDQAEKMRFTEDERDPMLPVNHQRQSAEVAAVEDRLNKLAESVERTRLAADRAQHDYQQATRLIFRRYFARLKTDANQIGYSIEGELANNENGRFKCEMRVGIEQKPPVSYASPDLSGGQKAALSILMAMTAVSLDSAEGSGFFLVDEPFSASDVYKINELGEFLARTHAQYLISMPTSSDVAHCGGWLSATWTSTKSPGGFDTAGRPVLAPPIRLGFARGARDVRDARNE